MRSASPLRQPLPLFFPSQLEAALFAEIPLDPSLGRAATQARGAAPVAEAAGAAPEANAAAEGDGLSASEDPEEVRLLNEALEVSEGLDFNIAEGGEEEAKETDEAVDVS